MAVQRIVFEGVRTWTVTGADHLPAGPVEEFLDHLRLAGQASPNTVRSYATSLDRWWAYLSAAGLAWDEVTLPAFTPYLASLRTGRPPGVAVLPGAGPAGGLAEATVAVRVAAVLSFYRYHADVHGVPVAGWLHRAGRRAGRYLPALAHLRQGQQPRPAVRIRRPDNGPMPVLTPGQIQAILDECARWDAAAGSWAGSVRNRLLFAALAGTGLRLGECLSTRHCDWHAGRGGTPFIEVVPRQDHPAGRG
jgi:integrase/recombinase XerD